MTRGKSRLTVGAICVLATVLVVTPAPASAAPGVDEYTLNLPDGGGGDSGEETTTAPAPVYPTTPTYETYAPTEVTGVTRERKKRKPEELAPALTASSPNATLGPAKTPTLSVRDDDDAIPAVAIVLAAVAAACCLLAVWRLRFLRELPAAPRRRAPRSAI
jgi:hypothetical protein